MRAQLQGAAMALVDHAAALIPRPVPDAAALRKCKIISHRGEHDNRDVFENTLQAFANASAAGVWGIECDIRWTADGVPVVCHDPCTTRVFGRKLVVGQLKFAQLRSELPLIPSLAELIARFGGRTHLMLELKERSGQHAGKQTGTLAALLAGLQAGVDFHVLSLDPVLFSLVEFLDPSVLLPVAETNVNALSRLSLQRQYGGLTGHYLLLGAALLERHQAAGQQVGTGFPRSRNCLFREINRGVDWIFTNDAVYLQGVLEEALARQ